MSDKTAKRRFKLSPSLYDGDHWTIVDDPDVVLAAVSDWLKEVGCGSGDPISISVIKLTDKEMQAIPEDEG